MYSHSNEPCPCMMPNAFSFGLAWGRRACGHSACTVPFLWRCPPPSIAQTLAILRHGDDHLYWPWRQNHKWWVSICICSLCNCQVCCVQVQNWYGKDLLIAGSASWCSLSAPFPIGMSKLT